MVGLKDETLEDAASNSPGAIIFRILGVSNGPALYMMRSFLLGTTSAITLGTATAAFGGMLFGNGLIPFVVGSCLGFTGATVGFGLSAAKESLVTAARYPSLLLLHLNANYPTHDLRHWTAREFKEKVDRGELSINIRCLLIASWLTASPALEQIRNRQEEDLVKQYTTGDDASKENGRLEIGSS